MEHTSTDINKVGCNNHLYSLIKNIPAEMHLFCSMHRNQRLNHKWFKVYMESTVTNQTHGFICKHAIVYSLVNRLSVFTYYHDGTRGTQDLRMKRVP